jgi:glutamine---fructose-6-phosphate transaminase (isomerizing)
MCGILGIVRTGNSEITDKQYKEIVRDLFIFSSRRGKEASGYAIADGKEILVLKTPLPADEFVRTDEFNRYLSEKLRINSGNSLTTIGHSRLVTNGSELENINNQPVIKNGIAGIHNGIIVNDSNLWTKINESSETSLDSEVIFRLVRYFSGDGGIHEGIAKTFKEIYGTASTAMVFEENDNLILATNNGSLYYTVNRAKSVFLFASESLILKQVIRSNKLIKIFNSDDLNQVEPNHFLNLQTSGLKIEVRSMYSDENYVSLIKCDSKKIIKNIPFNSSPKAFNSHFAVKKSFNPGNKFIFHFEKSADLISNMLRCSKCLLPETFPFIEFDSDGICNYCNSYQNLKVKGENDLKSLTNKYISHNSKPNVIIGLSGGRDSCFTLHYAKKVLGLNPIAYSYDWGMLTDLARRNQSRLCSKLGIEHILISADIRKKREYIRKNVSAWLKKPVLGLIPLFMAGDKQYFYYANMLLKDYNIDFILFGENLLETTFFKYGFCNIKPNLQYKEKSFTISRLDKMSMIWYYTKEYLKNPLYINSSLSDSFSAFKSFYYIPHTYYNLFGYMKWNEFTIIKTLRDEYDWETDPGTTSTWRIGDGTAAFYNYIYYIVAGFTENDTFRSNQIREGYISRKDAMKLSTMENKPRWDSIKWYCDTIGIDFYRTIEIINNIPNLYTNR